MFAFLVVLGAPVAFLNIGVQSAQGEFESAKTEILGETNSPEIDSSLTSMEDAGTEDREYHDRITSRWSMDDGSGTVATDVSNKPATVNEDSNTTLDEKVHQGYSFGDGSHYLIDTDQIFKYDSSWNKTVSNTDALENLSGDANHLGDGTYYDGDLYVTAENFTDESDFPGNQSQQIAVYDGETLELKSTHNLSTEHEVSSAVVVPSENEIWITSYYNETTIYRHSLSDFSLVDKIELEKEVPYIQGIAKNGSRLYLSSDAGSKGGSDIIYRVQSDGSDLTLLTEDETEDFATEGLDYHDEKVWLLKDASSSHVVSYNEIRGRYNASFAGSPKWTSRGSVTGGSAIYLDGSSYLEAPKSQFFSGDTLTQSTWIESDPANYSKSRHMGLLGLSNDADTTGERASVVARHETEGDLAYWDESNGWVHSGVNVTDGNLHQVGVEIEYGEYVAFIVNGSEVANKSIGTHSFSQHRYATLGRTNTNGEEDFVGTVDESRFYRTGLNDSQWSSLYQDPDVLLGVASTGASGSNLNGTVENQAGNPISNATVHLYYSTLPTDTEARDQLDSISDPTPTTFTDQLNTDFSVMGESDGLATKKDFVPAIYSPEELGTAPWVDNADLGDPHWRQVPQDESFTVTIADTRDGVDKGVLSGEYANQMYGHPYKDDDGTVTFQRLSASADPLGDPIEFELNKQAGGGFGDPSSMQYAEIPADALQPGFYTVTAEVDGDKKGSYVIRVGSPRAAVDQYLETTDDVPTEQAQQAQQAIADSELVHKTVSTNSDGEWSADVPSNAKVVQVQAMKAPGVDVEPEDLTRDNVTAADASAESAPNASVYFPSRVRRVSLPADDVTVTLVESRFPPTADMSQLQGRLEELRSMLNNLTLADLRPGPLNEGVDQARSELAATWSELRGILMQFEPARERYLEMSDRETVPTASELDESELQTAISTADTAITSTQSTAEATEQATETADGTISKAWEVSGIDLSEANFSVIAHYSNGTRTTVSSEYVTVDDGAITDSVRLEEFPYGEDDPAQVSFRLDVAGPSDSIGEDASEYATDETVVKNPTYNGEVPAIASIELSSIRPGPNDDVSLTVNEERESSFRQLVDVTVYAPDGSTVPAGDITDGDTVDFQTDGQGVYRVEYTVQNREGKNFTDTISVRAAESDQDLEPGLYAHSGPMGNIALASDGLSGGSVHITDSGRVEAIAQLPEDSDTPNEVQIYTSGLSTGPETPIEVRLVEGEDRQSVDQHTYVRIHGKRISDDALVYRNDDQPITRDGDTRYGEVAVDADGASILTWTDENGVVETTVNNDPGWLDKQRYRVAIWTAGTDLPLVSVVPDLPAGPVLPGLRLTAAAGGAVVAGRRRAR